MTSQVQASAFVVVAASAEQGWSLLLAPLRYRTIDTRLTDLVVLKRTGRQLRLRVRGYFLFTLLESSAEVDVTLKPTRTLEYRAIPGSFSLPGSLAIEEFRGLLRLEETETGTRVSQQETYLLKNNIFGRLIARLGAGWLQRHFDEIHMPRLKQVLEREAGAETNEHDSPLPGAAPGGRIPKGT